MNLTKMNLFIKIFLLVCLILILPTETVYATNIPIFVDNVPAYSEVSPFYQNDTLLVPARLVSEELGATVDWQNEQISISCNDCNIVLYVGQNQADVNGTSQNLSAPPQIVQGRLFVPLRFIGESLGARVLYRDGKIFLYSTNYDGALHFMSGTIKYGDDVYFIESGTGHILKQGQSGKSELIIDDEALSLLAVSRSGLVYTNYRWVFYYNFATKKRIEFYQNNDCFPPYAYSYYTDNGNFYCSGYAESKIAPPVSNQKYSDSYYAIFSIDIDGANKKEIFVEELNCPIRDIKYRDGWIYYIADVSVKRDYGIDYAGGSVNRVRADGTGKQQLSGERGSYYFTEDGVYCKWGYNAESRFWRFDELD